MSPTNRLPIYSKLNLSRMKARPLYLSDGRIFYLWQDDEARELFESLGFKICDFSKSATKTGSGDFWLSYVLDPDVGIYVSLRQAG